MTVRGRLKISMAISSTTAEEKDLGNGYYEIVSDANNDGGSWKYLLPVSSTDVPVPLGGIANATLIGIRTVSNDPTLVPVNVTFKKNSTGGEVNTIAPMGGQEGWYISTTSGLTALYFSNPSSTTAMQITLFVLGA